MELVGGRKLHWKNSQGPGSLLVDFTAGSTGMVTLQKHSDPNADTVMKVISTSLATQVQSPGRELLRSLFSNRTEQECNIIALASTVGCGSHLAGCYTRIPKDRDWHYLLRVWDWTIKKQHMFITQIYLFLPFRYTQLTYITIYLCVYSFIGGEMMTNNDVCKSH